MPRDPDAPPFTLQSLFWNGVFCTSVLGSVVVWRRFLRRIPTAADVPDSILKKRTLLGYVVSVGDADNFRFFHTPGGYLAGWGWLRATPKVNERGITDQTIMVRLDGVDAPELAHFGKPAQRFSGEALAWLRGYVLGRRVRIVPLAKDQYQRLLAEARVWKWNGRRNVSRDMLRAGWCTVYEGKTGAEFNGLETQFRLLEQQARRKKIGIWSNKHLETPAEYKRKYR